MGLEQNISEDGSTDESLSEYSSGASYFSDLQPPTTRPIEELTSVFYNIGQDEEIAEMLKTFSASEIQQVQKVIDFIFKKFLREQR